MKIAVENKSKLYIALITTLISLIILVTGTYAWFTLSLSGKVQEMELNVTAGDSLYVDAQSHQNSLDAWKGHNFVSTSAIESQLGITLGAIVMDPVTSGNGKKFYNKDGIEIVKNDKHYLQFDLYFFATRDMNVRLAGNSDGEADGTKVTWKSNGVQNSPLENIEKCVRISFATEGAVKAKIFEPNKPTTNGNTTLSVGNAKTDNGGSATITTNFTDDALGQAGAELFPLKKEQEQKVTVYIWLEGEDPECIDNVRGSVFLTRLRFLGV